MTCNSGPTIQFMPFDGHEKTGLNIPVLDKFSSIWVRWDRIIRAYRDNTRFVVIIVRDYDDVNLRRRNP
jgi:hypothetical protein